VYVLLLGAAYGRAQLSVFYPLARGLAPVLVLAVAALVLGATTSWRQAPAVISAAVVAARSGRPALHAAFRTETILIAPLMLAPYSLVLYALRLAPAAPVAAVRETSVLVVPRSRRRC
jgi:hypothetical protein